MKATRTGAGHVGRMLQVEAAAYSGSDTERATQIVAHYMGNKVRIPGLGHPHHTVDPRAEKLLALQEELGLPNGYTKLMKEIHSIAVARRGSHLTFNAVAAVGAIASDLGLDWRVIRGIGLVARSIGLVGHIFEELKSPSSKIMWELIEDHTDYADPLRT